MKLKISNYLDIGILYCLYALIFFIPISIAGISIFAGLAILLFVIRQIITPDFQNIRTNKTFFLLLLVFFFFMALSLFNSGPLLGKSLKALFLKWGRFPLLLWVMIDTLRDSRRIINAVWIFALSSTILALTSFSQKFLGHEFIFGHPLNPGGIITGSFKNQNDLAAYLTAVIPMILGFALWKTGRKFTQIGLFILSALLLCVCAMTLCRGGWLGLAVGLISIVLLICSHHLSQKTFWPLAVSGYLFFVPLTALALFFFQSRGDSARLMLYEGAWKMIVENPFLGKGLGTYMDHCANYIHQIGVYYVHNCFLQIWAESGIFSLLSFLLLNGYVIYKNFNLTLRIPASLESFLFIGLNAGLLGFLVHCFFDTQLYSLQLSFLFWITMGLTLALYTNLKQG